ncbi:MAG: TolC family protein [Candidatus Obscuribacterales bacterium]|nr:TolC family protein [Candidatus Obscuribacterales bacterium]
MTTSLRTKNFILKAVTLALLVTPQQARAADSQAGNNAPTSNQPPAPAVPSILKSRVNAPLLKAQQDIPPPPTANPPPPGFLTNPPAGTKLEDLYPSPTPRPVFTGGSTDPQLRGPDLEKAREVSLEPVPMSQLLPIGRRKLPAIRLEASYNEIVPLRDCLNYALYNSLPIRISDAGFDSQKYLFVSSLGQFLPDLTQTYRYQQVDSQRPPITNTYTDSTTVRFPVFQGGGVFYNALVNLNRTKAAKNSYRATVNDTLLEVYRRYNELILNHVLLQIRVKSVELSRAQLSLNEQLKEAGVGTNFAIYQSRTQLALDKQALLQQEVLVRQSAIQLAVAMNANLQSNIYPDEMRAVEARLVDQDWNINQLVAVASKRRPELKQFEELRIAARRNVQVAASPLYPTFQFFASKTHSTVGSNDSGSGGNNAGLSGSTVIIPTGGGGGGIGISGNGGRSFSGGFDLSWNLDGMGVVDAGRTLSARAVARQAMLQSNQQLLTVLQEIHNSYLNMLTASEQVDVAGEAVFSSSEQLRLANLRLRYGQGINLELIQAQRDYINSLTIQAQAIINYNISQAQLLRDTGMISVGALTATRPPKISSAGTLQY